MNETARHATSGQTDRKEFVPKVTKTIFDHISGQYIIIERMTKFG